MKSWCCFPKGAFPKGELDFHGFFPLENISLLIQEASSILNWKTSWMRSRMFSRKKKKHQKQLSVLENHLWDNQDLHDWEFLIDKTLLNNGGGGKCIYIHLIKNNSDFHPATQAPKKSCGFFFRTKDDVVGWRIVLHFANCFRGDKELADLFQFLKFSYLFLKCQLQKSFTVYFPKWVFVPLEKIRENWQIWKFERDT